MIELAHHQPEPTSLEQFRSRTPNVPWSTLPLDIKDAIHAALDIEQENLCVYCETKIDRNSCHLEHLKPKRAHQNLKFRYSNLAQSCNSRDHCGHRKAGQEIPVLPGPECNSLFSLSGLDGKLSASPDLDPQKKCDVENTIEIQGLNSPDIARRRQQYYEIVLSLQNDAPSYIRDQPFRHILQTVL